MRDRQEESFLHLKYSVIQKSPVMKYLSPLSSKKKDRTREEQEPKITETQDDTRRPTADTESFLVAILIISAFILTFGLVVL
jgi:hypothetical protein